MKDQNRQLHADIKTAMAKSTAHKAKWSHINAVHSLGREPKQYSVTEGDGLGLFWMMTMLYRPADEAYRENLEQGTYALCRKLSLQSKGNPTKFIEDLRAQLLDANALGVKLKWILTGKMVVTNMANRSNILAQKLQGYLDGSAAVERDDCAARHSARVCSGRGRADCLRSNWRGCQQSIQHLQRPKCSTAGTLQVRGRLLCS